MNIPAIVNNIANFIIILQKELIKKFEVSPEDAKD